jgi:GH25 family lysozyme M1 (1,4-beta-N-acetylmuramidase)
VSTPPTDSVEEAQRVCAAGFVVKGVDVSHYDGAIDWAKAKASIDFAFMKATESTNFVDPQFATNWKNSGASGVIRGAYHFFRPATDPIQQADYFLSVMGPSLPGDLPPSLDLEVLDNLTGAQVTQAALQFLQRVQQKTNRVPIVYTSARVMTLLGNPPGFTPYTLWVANWTNLCPSLPPEWMNWTFWQYSDTGVVNGITSQQLDLDQFNGTLSDLQGYADGGTGHGGSGDGGSGVDGGSGDLDGGHGGTSDGGDGGEARDGGGVDADSGTPDLGPVPGRSSGCSFLAGDDARVDALGVGILFVVLTALWTRRRGRTEVGGVPPLVACALQRSSDK